MFDLTPYANKRICVAVSGGKDSMALLHYINVNGGDYGITLSALNCDHKIRGEASARDSAFVKEWCNERGIPLLSFVWTDYEIGSNSEKSAREWRRSCYLEAMRTHVLSDGSVWQGADAVATAHHMNDNAETVLFNLARGSGLAGMKGISDSEGISANSDEHLVLIRPLISCTRAEIDAYIGGNGVPYVNDESNFTDNYTRNRIRHNVLPELEKAVPGAVKGIYRFSRLAADDEEYFDGKIKELGLVKSTIFGCEVLFCDEKVIFRRAVLKALNLLKSNLTDYTSAHLRKIYDLQFAENGKKFEFLNFTAYKQEVKIVICENKRFEEKFYCKVVPECELERELRISEGDARFIKPLKVLKFDSDGIPSDAVMRNMADGDRFTKFGGGTKKLGDYFTDKKIPVCLRKRIPLIASGGEVLAVCGVEISEKIKITEQTKDVGCIVCADFLTLSK